MLVQEQTGNVTYDITGFKRIMICDELTELKMLENMEDKDMEDIELFSIRISFHLEGDGKDGILLGRYGDYHSARRYYDQLLSAVVMNEPFFSMIPVEERELSER